MAHQIKLNLNDKTVMEGEIGDYSEPVLLHKVDETKWEQVWDRLVREHHYLGYVSVIGGRVKYLITLGHRLVGAISYCSGAYKLGLRDMYIGWDEEARLKMLPHLVNNNRFLILPWVRIQNLASHVLALSVKRLREDWKTQYEVEPYLIETFVDTEKFQGSCYVAANWVYLGETKGFGRQGNSFIYHGQTKSIYVKVINRRIINLFQPNLDRLPNEKEEILAMISAIPLRNPQLFAELGITNENFGRMENLLTEHLAPFIPYLGRQELTQHFVAFVKGLLSDLPRKTMDPISKAYEGPDEIRNMSNFMSRSEWDTEGMIDEHRNDAACFFSEPNAMLTLDLFDFLKQGLESVGVDMQYCSRLGKTTRCQVSVMAGFAGETGGTLIDFALFMPEIWFSEHFAPKREKSKVPEDLQYKSKIRYALDMIDKLTKSGQFNFTSIGVDSSLGQEPAFLDALPKDMPYFAEIPGSLEICPLSPISSDAATFLGNNGKRSEEPREISVLSAASLAELSDVPWAATTLEAGDPYVQDALLPIQDKCVRARECRDGKPGQEIWLYAFKSDGPTKYALSNVSSAEPQEALRRLARRRWTINRSFFDCQTRLGMGRCEARSWAGWHRHILQTLIAHLFLSKLRREFLEQAEPETRPETTIKTRKSRRNEKISENAPLPGHVIRPISRKEDDSMSAQI
ncbi:MAG: DUF4338 domain-containing protein [Deltaproteobacteria bacterium]|jgi:SRSO17 transposase|nr:DUF4338 domain-containing protein [Deltaproteobacteria bacterium]